MYIAENTLILTWSVDPKTEVNHGRPFSFRALLLLNPSPWPMTVLGKQVHCLLLVGNVPFDTKNSEQKLGVMNRFINRHERIKNRCSE